MNADSNINRRFACKTGKQIALQQLAMIAVCILVVSSSAWGDVSQNSFQFKPVVRTGDVAPVPPQLGSILEFAFNDQGQIAAIADGGLLLKSGNQITPIAAEGDFAPGGSLFFSVDVPALGPQGQVVFRGNVVFPGTSGLYQFSNGNISLLLADGTTATDGESVTPGEAAFVADGTMLVADAFTGNLFLFSNGTLTRLVGQGDAAPGGGSFTFLTGAVINASHQVAFEAFLSTGGNGIFLLSGGTVTKIIASGDIMPDGVPFGFADAPAINDLGQVVFNGNSNSIADSGIFSFLNGQLSVVVPRGAPLPNGIELNVIFTTHVNNAGEIAFTALDLNNVTGVFLFANGQIQVLETGGQAAPDGGTFGTSTDVGAAINQSGQVLFFAQRLLHGSALYLFSNNQLSRVIGQGDTIPRQPTFEFPTALALGGADRVLISDSTFPGGNGAYIATPSQGNQPGKMSLAVHVGETIGADGVVIFLFGSSMNQGGQVAAGVNSDASGTILLSSGGALTVVADSSTGSSVDPNGSTPSINDNGDIAFTGFAPATQTNGVFLNSAGQTQLLLNEATQLPDGTTLNDITNYGLNNQESLAFAAAPIIPNSDFFLFSNGQLTTLATEGGAAPGGGTFQIFFGDSRLGPVINNQGEVAFASSLSGLPGGFFGSGGVFLFRNGTLTRVVGPNDPSPDGGVFLFADAPSINSAGDITFFAETSAFSFGAFVFHNGQISKVAVAGDTVNGEILGFVDLPVFNNGGDIAFTASLLDGSNAIFVAAPKNADGSDNPGWSDSAPGGPASAGEVSWQKKKRDLAHAPHNHLGQNVRKATQPQN